MKIQIRGGHMQLTDALVGYVNQKFRRLSDLFEESEAEVTVVLSVIHNTHRAEATLHVNGLLLRAQEDSQDMYASIDFVAHTLEQQILKHKARLNEHFRQKGVRTRIRSVETQNKSFAEEPSIVRVKQFELKPMDVDEARLQLELLGHQFFVFMNAETNAVNVMYRRTDGNLALIEPR